MKKTITFSGRRGFQTEVKKRVNQYFEENNLSRHANWRMVAKTASILTGFVAAYVLFLLYSSTFLSAIAFGLVVGQGFVLVGTNIMHDGAHGSYSKNRNLNWLMAFTLDLVGGSNIMWRPKHNILHHTYTNINELDDDLHSLQSLRFTPDQPWRPVHRFQHLYAFPLYSLLTLGWVLEGDFKKFFSGKIGDYEFARPSRIESILFFTTKLFFFGYMLVLPMFFHPVLHVLAFFLAANLIAGLSLATIFQLAHIMDENEFPMPDSNSREIENEWAIHQVETTANFAPNNKLATWYCGGLNFQIEHHLFPRVCHVHYPAISNIVKQTCEDFKIAYTSYPTFRSAIAEHYRFLRKLGQQEVSVQT